MRTKPHVSEGVSSSQVFLGLQQDSRSRLARGLLWVCGRSLVRFVGSNHAEDMDVCLV